MDSLQFLTEYNPLWIIACLLTGALAAFLLYLREQFLAKWFRIALSVLRFAAISLIALLLLNPFLRLIERLNDKPIIAIAVDNSQSMNASGKTAYRKMVETISGMAQDLEDIGKVEIYTLQDKPQSPDSIKASFPNTDISAMLDKIQSDNEGKNLSGIILVSDGLVNAGLSPENTQYAFPVHTLAYGDTTPTRDVSLKAPVYNKISFAGNQIPIQSFLYQYGFSATTPFTIQLKEDGKLLSSKTITNPSGSTKDFTFIIDAGTPKLRHLTIETPVQDGERNTINNIQHLYIEILDGKQKVLIAAAAPHPDVKAIRAALEQAENFEVSVAIPDVLEAKETNYDLIIYHNLPHKQGWGNALLTKYQNFRGGVWYIVGVNTNMAAFNSVNKLLTISQQSPEPDRVNARYNDQFSLFTYDENSRLRITKFPPLESPFGNYALQPLAATNAEIMFYQSLGNALTSKPLLALGLVENRKVGVLAGEGIWHWRLEEYSDNQNHTATDEFIQKTAKYLSTKTDSRKLKIKPLSNTFLEGERVVFDAQTYNQVYELIFGQKVLLSIKGKRFKEKQFSFTTSESNPKFDIGQLPPDVYQWTAEATIAGKQEKISGQFMVTAGNLELQNTTANWSLLKEISRKTNGEFQPLANAPTLVKNIRSKPLKTIIRSKESIQELINLKWIFWLIVSLLSIEWFIRKFKGTI